MRQKETKAERFVRVAEQRTQRAVDAIHSLSNCASRVCYDYTPEQVEQIIAALEAEVKRLQICRREPLYTAPISQRPRMISGASHINQYKSKGVYT